MKREEIEESVSKVLEANTYEQVNKNLYLTKNLIILTQKGPNHLAKSFKY